MKLRIRNKKKFIVRIIELLIIIASIVLTTLAINYANRTRGYHAFGGEYLILILGLLAVLVIETVYEESENKKKGKKKNGIRK